MGTPQYIKNAQNKYNAKFDLVQLKLPKGTKERIKAALDDGQSIAGYCVQSVLVALENDEEYLQNVQEAAGQESADKLPEEAENTRETPKTDAKILAELQAIIDAKKAEIEAAKQEQETHKEEKSAETIAAEKFAEK